MAATETSTLGGMDLTTCDREPIHIPGSIQPHGTLLVLEEGTYTVLQAAANAGDFLSRRDAPLIGRGLRHAFGDEIGALLTQDLANPSLERNPLYLRTLTVPADGRRRSYHMVAHRHEGVVILELEPADSEGDISFQGLYPLIRSFLATLPTVPDSRELNRLAAKEVRRITDFDRVLIYRFDADGHGTVVAEDRNDVLPSYDDLRFPASDIPKQARDLYLVNRLRLIADAGYDPVSLTPAFRPDGRPVDLSYASLRSVSPVHVQYMKNMGTSASMSISILRGGELWGLISCHNKTPRIVPFEVRTACDFLGQVLSAHLEVKEHNEEHVHRAHIKAIGAKLLSFMAEEEQFIKGLTDHPAELTALAEADGAAVVIDESCVLMGRTPGEEAVRNLVAWLSTSHDEEVVVTDSLPTLHAPAEAYKDSACGLLAVSISKLHRSYVLWFRPELVRTVHWGGDPRKPTEPTNGDAQRLAPRASFEVWKETVRLRSRPWAAAEVETARELRSAIVNIVLRRAEELAEVSEGLKRSNKELEAFSYSVSHDLRAPLRHVVGYAELLRSAVGDQVSSEARRYIDTIIDSAKFAGMLVDNLLSFSRVGRTAIYPVPVDMGRLVEEVRNELEPETNGRSVDWRIGPLPTVQGDLMMLKLAVRNLLSNAVKYTKQQPEATIEVGCKRGEREDVFHVRDNGVGFDMAYIDKLFGVFQRLHRWEDFEGTGIGLANVRRVAERHGGRAWAEGKVGQGATFYLALPRGAR